MRDDNVISFRRLLARWRARSTGGTGWLRPYQRLWEMSLNRLEAYMQTLKQGETSMDDLRIEALPGRIS